MATLRNPWRLIMLAGIWLTVLLQTEAIGCVKKKCHKGGCQGPWAGIYPTVLTPFTCEGGIDVVSLERQIHFELKGGVHGLLVLGTIGEGEYVTEEERAQVVATAVHAACGAPVVVGIHTCDEGVASRQVLQAKELGAAAVLVKYIGNPNASGEQVLCFFAALSEMNALPIFYYHYPSQTGLKLSPQQVADILMLPNVIGIKESTLNLREVKDHLSLTCGQGKVFLSGTSLNLTQFMDLGGQGAMCPEAVLLPGPTVAAYDAYVQGRPDEARALQKKLFELMPVVSSNSAPTAVARMMLMSAEDHLLPMPMSKDHPQAKLKAALNCQGVPTSPAVRCPLPPLSSSDQRRVQRAMGKVKDIDWCEVTMQVPPIPWHTCGHEEEGGLSIKTGAMQFGAGESSFK